MVNVSNNYPDWGYLADLWWKIAGMAEPLTLDIDCQADFFIATAFFTIGSQSQTIKLFICSFLYKDIKISSYPFQINSFLCFLFCMECINQLSTHHL